MKRRRPLKLSLASTYLVDCTHEIGPRQEPFNRQLLILRAWSNVYKFRQVKWGNLREKLKVLAEDIQRTFWLDGLTPIQFGVLVAVVIVFVFTAIAAAAFYLH